jgi:hypothetical protein
VSVRSMFTASAHVKLDIVHMGMFATIPFLDSPMLGHEDGHCMCPNTAGHPLLCV